MPLTAFHPTVRRWFESRFDTVTEPQRRGWPEIRAGRHTLIAAPTGSGKTLAAFLHALDELFSEPGPGDGGDLPDETRVLYISPLKALGNDVQKNLRAPLAEMREMDPALPEVRVLVRSGDTRQSERAKMRRRPPHVLVTTPESLYILLTSQSGRAMLSTVRTVIVDEIHAVLGSKRGSHLSLSLERLSGLAGTPVQRVGLSATQKPLSDVARFLVGVGRDCVEVDAGHLREIDIAIEVPETPLETVCSHETWEEIYGRIAELVADHRTTLVFVNTRKLAERVSARLEEVVGKSLVACHHGSLSKERRLDAEQRLKAGRLRALVSTASLELGIDVGDVDLVIQCAMTPTIAAFLQRVGRAGHALGRVPRGRIFPLTRDELVASVALFRSVRAGDLDRTPQPRAPLDILLQHIVAECVGDEQVEDELYARLLRAWPYRELTRAEFDETVHVHTEGRRALLHRDSVGGRLRATRRARIPAITGGGAIPDNAQYRVLEEPAGTLVGQVHEDFAIESSAGDIFELGATSWRVLRVSEGVMRVADAEGAPPSLPFWVGEAPARSAELSDALSRLREERPRVAEMTADPGIPESAAEQVEAYLDQGFEELGAMPTRERLVLERFFDETGGMQVVLHAPFGSRVNRALGLALRKKFCVGFGFELQAAANEESIVLSIGLQHSFPLEEVFDYLHPNTAREVLVQAMLPAPMFGTRWRWNVTRALVVPRFQGGRRVPAPLLRMRADDALAQQFPAVLACPETLDHGPLEIPMDRPLVRQTVEDCLFEAMDVDGFLDVLRGLRDGSIERVAIDRPSPSVLALAILNGPVYTFLDDAPLEERRTRAVQTRHALTEARADSLGALDAEAVRRVCEEAWPDADSADEVHEALLWMGFLTAAEGAPWSAWLDELRVAGRVVCEDGRWFAAEASRDPLEIVRSRLEALGPVPAERVGATEAMLLQLEQRGDVLRVRHEGETLWCQRRLLARVHRYTLDRLRREIRPVPAADFLRFLGRWQHVDPEHLLDGQPGVAEVLRQLAGYEAPAASWEASILKTRVRGYRREWLDHVTLSGEFAWGRLWGAGRSAIRATPIAFVPREWLHVLEGLAGPADSADLQRDGEHAHEALRRRGAAFAQDLVRTSGLLPAQLDKGLGDLVAHGLASCDSFAGLRRLIIPPSRRRNTLVGMPAVGRWSPFRSEDVVAPDEAAAEVVARLLLRRWGVVFRRVTLRERIAVPWRLLLKVLRRMELRGEVRGGRFVAGFSGEQYALPGAVKPLRAARRKDGEPEFAPLTVAAADPLNLRGILTPGEWISPATRGEVVVA